MEDLKNPQASIDSCYDIGCNKTKTKTRNLIILGILAGIFIALGSLGAIIGGKGIAPTIVNDIAFEGIERIVFAAIFALGLIFVVFAGSELFTGNTFALMPAFLSRKIFLKDLLKNWGWVYSSNFIGALFIVALVYASGIIQGDPYVSAVKHIAENKVSLGFFTAFWRGIGCNFLVCLAIWMSTRCNSAGGKIFTIWGPVFLFVLVGFEHSIANMFFIPLGMVYNAKITISQFLGENLLPVTIGNIIGGAFFVGTVYWWVYGRLHEN